MANTQKVLGQAVSVAATNVNVYTVPASTNAAVSTLVICNRGASATYSVAVRPAGAALSNEHYLIYNAALGPNESTFLTIGMSLEATDVITLIGSTADLSITAFGVEIA